MENINFWYKWMNNHKASQTACRKNVNYILSAVMSIGDFIKVCHKYNLIIIYLFFNIR